MKVLYFILLISLHSEAKLFTIAHGDHYSTPKIVRTFNDSRMNLTVTFDPSAIYQLDNPDDQADTNKLYGFSDCLNHHMENSARFGWRTTGGMIEVMAFTHKAGKYNSIPITTVVGNRPYEASIELSPDRRRYIYTFNGITVSDNRGCDHRNAQGYHLTPYFGGQSRAPHEIKIRVDANEKTGPVFVEHPFPNPVTNNEFSVKVRSWEDVSIYFMIYDLKGRLMWKSASSNLNSDQMKTLRHRIDKYLAAGIYLLLPVVIKADGTELRGSLSSNTEGEVFKIFINSLR